MNPPKGGKYGVVIGIPSVGWQTTTFMAQLLQMAMPLNCVVHYKIRGSTRYGDPRRPTAEQWNVIINESLGSGAQYLFCLEEDVIVPQLALRQLMGVLGHNPDATIAAGVATTKTMPPEPMVYRGDGLGAYWGFKPGEVFEVDSVHMGCTLIRLEHLTALTVPLVEVQDYPTPGEKAVLREFCRTSTEPTADGLGHVSNDIFLCRAVRAAGKKILVDAGVNCGHWDHERQMMFGLPIGGPPIQTDAEVVNLGCGLDWDFIDGIRPLRVDVNDVNQPDFRADLRALPKEWTGRFDIVYSSHVLEHFDRYELPGVFAEMVRICKPGGEIRLEVPSLEWAVQQIVKDGKLSGKVIDVIWGGRSVPAVGPYPQMYHKMGISRSVIAELAAKHRLSGRSQLQGYSDTHRLFKGPLKPEVAEWLKDKGDFKRRFVGPKGPEQEEAASETPTEATQETVEETEQTPSQ